MRPTDNIKKIIQSASIKTNPKVNKAVLNRLFDELDKSRANSALPHGRRTSILQPNIWRTIMKSKITKFAAAAIIAIAAVLSISVFFKSVPTAFGIEQVIDAYNNVRFLHVKQLRPGQKNPNEFWIKSDEQGRVAKARYYLPVTEDGVKLITWTPERTEIWFKSKHGFRILQTKRVEDWMQSILEQCQPKLVMKKLLEDQKAGKVDVDIQKPAIIVATYKTESKKEIYYIEQATDLITRIEFYSIKDNKEVLKSTTELCDYNVPIDEKMFSLKDDLPKDVSVADQLNQLIGVPQGNMTDEQAAEETIRQYLQALIDKDYKKAGLICGGELEEYAKEEFGWCDVNAILSIGPPIPQPNWVEHGFRVPCVLEIITRDGQKITRRNTQYVRPGDDEMHPDRWNITSGGFLDEGQVQVILPDNEKYEKMTPKEAEASAIEGFRFFSKLTNGRYPSMNMTTTMQEAEEALVRDMNIDTRAEPNDRIRQKLISKAMKLQRPFIFYSKLAKEGKDPAYYGDKVSAEFGESVLMRWKVADKQYRVIFGDLTVDTVSAEKLAELEAMSLNRTPKAIKPKPADGTVSGNIDDLELSWMPGMYITEHKVYMGTAPDKLSLLADISGHSNLLSPHLQRDTTYYWRVDEIDVNGTVTAGDVWSFYTGKLVGWWKLDENTGTIAYDSSNGGNNGTLIGNPVWQPSGGAIGGALELNGKDDFVKIDNESAFDITGQITISAWVNITDVPQEWTGIVTKGDSAWRLSSSFAENVFHLGISYDDYLNGQTTVDSGKWHNVVCVYDGHNMSIYVDGILDVSRLRTGPIGANDYPVCIGENIELTKHRFHGLIDDVRIYNYALSEDEVGGLYNVENLSDRQ
jgi:hypothetical protein